MYMTTKNQPKNVGVVTVEEDEDGVDIMINGDLVMTITNAGTVRRYGVIQYVVGAGVQINDRGEIKLEDEPEVETPHAVLKLENGKEVRLGFEKKDDGGVTVVALGSDGNKLPKGKLIVFSPSGSLFLCRAVNKNLGFDYTARGEIRTV